jgi:hypothetical protein
LFFEKKTLSGIKWYQKKEGEGKERKKEGSFFFHPYLRAIFLDCNRTNTIGKIKNSSFEWCWSY